jgi:hypothetical protein
MAGIVGHRRLFRASKALQSAPPALLALSFVLNRPAEAGCVGQSWGALGLQILGQMSRDVV